MANTETTHQKDGRTYTVESGGITSLKRDYTVVLDSLPTANGERTTFPGVPEIDSAHPNFPKLFVDHYEVAEGTGYAKNTITVTVVYKFREIEYSGGGEEPEVADPCTEWGWSAGFDDREMTVDADGKIVRNSAGDPYDTVPNVSVPAPTFTKVIKSKERKSGAIDFTGKVNSTDVVIGGKSCPAGTLRCQVSEQRVFGDGLYNYQYTIQLQYRSNVVSLNGVETEIGWSVAEIEAGMRAKNSEGELEICRVPDKETGEMCAVTSPTLLDHQGYQISPTDPNGPYVTRYNPYHAGEFPGWFYSEPALVTAS